MFPPVPKVKGDGRVISESWEGAFGGIVDIFVSFTSGLELQEFVGSELGVVVDDVQVRVLGISNCSVFVVFCPGN